MLHKAKTLAGYTFNGRDGDVGRVDEFYFDDQRWVVRYLIADTGGWLSGRRVLLSPYGLGAVSDAKRQIAVDLSKKQIEASPPVECDKPVSRQLHELYSSYYGWPLYWGGPYMWGARPTLVRDTKEWKSRAEVGNGADPHLRSTTEVTGYAIEATDGHVGRVEDFVIDDETWAIRYLILDTRDWWEGKRVLISPKWISRVSWGDTKVFINLSREAVKNSPEFTDESALTHDYEVALHRHYKVPGYWTEESAEGQRFRQAASNQAVAATR